MPLPPSINCADCCAITCDAPTVEWDSRSASKTKCGESQFASASSDPDFDPNKRYLKYETRCFGYDHYFQVSKGGDGAYCCAYAEVTDNQDWDIVQTTTWSPDECTSVTAETGGGTRVQHQVSTGTAHGGGDQSVCDAEYTYEIGPNETSIGCGTGSTSGVPVEDRTTTITNQPLFQSTVTTGTNSITTEGSPADPCVPSDYTSLTAELSITNTATLSEEYTTAQLLANALAALPDLPGTWTGTAGSYFSLTPDELTNSIREGKYRLRFKVPTTRKRVNPCYKIDWVERFIPDEGDAVDTPMSWTWDGTIPDDYDPDDSMTWPITPEYTVAIPAENGETTVVDVVATCDDCA